MYQFHLASATITVFNAGDIQYDLADSLRLGERDWPAAFRADFGRPIHVPQQTTLIRIGGSVVVVDVGHPLMPDGWESFAIPGYTPPLPVHRQLAQHGMPAGDVTHVVITHAHFDHYDGLCDERGEPCFPNARHFLGRADWELDSVQSSLRDPNSLKSRTLGVIQRRDLLELIEGDFDLAEGVRVLAAPGETPGHQIVRAQSQAQGQTLYCVGDLYHHEVEVSYPELQATWADAEAMRASRTRFVEAALREDALIVAAHIRGVGQIQRVKGEVVWRNVGR